MKSYKIYYHDVFKVKSVKDGWSWPAFFFLWIWAFVKGLNKMGFALFGAFIGLGIISGISGMVSDDEGLAVLVWIIQLGIQVWIGTDGNQKRCEMLIRKGYVYQRNIQASNPEIAVLNFIQQGEED